MNEQKYLTYEWRYRKEDFHFCPRCGSRLSLEDLHVRHQPQLVCDNCRFIFYLDPKLVVTALALFEGRCLLLRRAEDPAKGRWGFPGGYVERGADVRATIAAEVREEAGIECSVHELIDICSVAEEGIVQLVFLATAASGRPRVNIESSAAAFFAPEQIPWNDLAFDSTHMILRAWTRGDYAAHLAARGQQAVG